jgi:hypothetical protein
LYGFFSRDRAGVRARDPAIGNPSRLDWSVLHRLAHGLCDCGTPAVSGPSDRFGRQVSISLGRRRISVTKQFSNDGADRDPSRPPRWRTSGQGRPAVRLPVQPADRPKPKAAASRLAPCERSAAGSAPSFTLANSKAASLRARLPAGGHHCQSGTSFRIGHEGKADLRIEHPDFSV